jgi:hypothetical protein
MNEQQIRAWLTTMLAAGGPIAALIMEKVGISLGDYNLYLQVVLAVVPGGMAIVWAWYRNREDILIKRAATMPSVKTIVVNGNATDKVNALAQSDAPAAAKIISEKQNASDEKDKT